MEGLQTMVESVSAEMERLEITQADQEPVEQVRTSINQFKPVLWNQYTHNVVESVSAEMKRLISEIPRADQEPVEQARTSLNQFKPVFDKFLTSLQTIYGREHDCWDGEIGV